MKFLPRITAVIGLSVIATTSTIALSGPVPAASTLRQTKSKAEAPAFPAVTVTDIKSSKPFKLASLASGKKPTLIWFWAPH